MRIGCAVPAPAVGRAWLLLCPSREGARGVSVTYLAVWLLAVDSQRGDALALIDSYFASSAGVELECAP
jgi:hypothetical protein